MLEPSNLEFSRVQTSSGVTHCNWTSEQLRLDARTPVRMNSNGSAFVIFSITTLLWPSGMQVVDLKKQLKDRGLSDDGLKAALQKRLEEAIAATGGRSGGGSGSGSSDGGGDCPALPLSATAPGKVAAAERKGRGTQALHCLFTMPSFHTHS